MNDRHYIPTPDEAARLGYEAGREAARKTILPRCPTCHTPTIPADAGREVFCPKCYEVVSRMAVSEPPKAPKAAVRGTREAQGAGSAAVVSVTFELPLPPTGCSPNRESHAHWRGRADAREQYRTEIARLVPAVCGPMFARATIHAEFFHGPAPGRYRARDAQNAIGGAKSLVDQLVELGYLPDDTAKCLTWGETVVHGARESGARACVVVRLERRGTE